MKYDIIVLSTYECSIFYYWRIMPRYNPLLSQLGVYHQQQSENRKADVLAQGKKLLDFSVGDPIDPVPEFIRQGLKDSIPSNCRYPKVKGSAEVREAMAGYVQRRFGVELDINKHIIPVSGSKEAVFHLPQIIIDPAAPDRKVIFPDPGYPVWQRGTLFAGGEAMAVPLSGDFVFRPWELDPEILKQTRILWINSPHNPSGAVMSWKDIERTVALCLEYDILLASDECYADIYSPSVEPPHSVLEFGLENVVALFSLSKRSGMTGYRSGFMAGDPEVIETFATYRSNPGVVPQSFINDAARLAWSDDYHVEERRVLFAQKKALFISFFDRIGWSTIGRDASLYLWIKIPEGDTSLDWVLRLIDQGVVVSSGDMFACSDAGDGYLRLAMVPSLNECKEAIDLWEKAL